MKKAVHAMFAALGASCCLWGYDANFWQAVDGDFNGKYSEVAHWSRGHLPNAGEDAVFENQAVPYTVEIDGDYSNFAFCKIGSSLPKAGDQPVTLAGAGSLAPSNSFYVYGGRKAVLGGQFRYLGSDIQLLDGASLTIRDSATVSTGGKAVLYKDAAFTLSGGVFNGYFVPYPTTVTSFAISVSGGVWNHVNAGQTALPAGVSASFTGGRINSEKEFREPRLLPQGAAEFHSVLDGAYSLEFSGSGTNFFSGTLYATNATMNDGPAFRVVAPQAFIGGGTLHADWFMPYYTGEGVFDLARINVRSLVYPQPTTVISFPGDITIGAFGDWEWQTTPKAVNAFGALTLDTADAFDGVTARRFMIRNLFPQFGGSLKTVGPGRATVAFANLGDVTLKARELDFQAAETSFSLDSSHNYASADYAVRVGRLRLGAGRKLTLFPAFNSIDSALPPEVDATAQIVVDLTKLEAKDGVGMPDGRLVFPVITSSCGDGVDLARFSITNNPGTWALCKCGPSVYLRDATAKRVNPAPYLWTGAVDGDWDKAGNWQGGAVPDSSSAVYLDVCDNTSEIVIPPAGAEVGRISGGGLWEGVWYRSCGAFVFKGGPLAISSASMNGYNSAMYFLGMLPVVFENDVEGRGADFGPVAYKGVVFRGALKTKTFCPRGDVRIGGVGVCESLNPGEKYTAQCRPSSLTVLPGGSFTATAQCHHVTVPFSFNVMAGGECRIPANPANAAGELYFDTREDCSHLVEGRLSFGLPISVNTNAQSFAGAGRVDFKEVVARGGEAVALRAMGGITLAPEAFHTVARAEHGASAVRIEVPDGQTATLAPRADLVYGAAPGVTPAVAAADRALRLGVRATLIVACADADDSAVPRDVTFADPVAAAAHARVVKTGAGRLTLASAQNSFGARAGVDLREGAFTWTDGQRLGFFKAAAGARLAVAMAGDELPVLYVADDVDLAGVALDVADKAAADHLRGRARPILKVAAGRRITGHPALPRGGDAKVVALADGGEALTYRLPTGMVVCIR